MVILKGPRDVGQGPRDSGQFERSERSWPKVREILVKYNNKSDQHLSDLFCQHLSDLFCQHLSDLFDQLLLDIFAYNLY